MQKSVEPEARGRPATATGGDVLDRAGAELRALPQRHDAVAAAGGVSAHQGVLRPRLRPDRADHAGVPADGLRAAARGRHDHRPQAPALFDGRGHGLHVRRPDRAGARGELCDAAGGRGADRHGVVGLPPRIRRAWRGSPPAAGTGSPSRCSRSAGRRARRSGRCLPPSSWCRAGRRASPGSRWWRCSPCSCCCRSAPGTSARRRSP